MDVLNASALLLQILVLLLADSLSCSPSDTAYLCRMGHLAEGKQGSEGLGHGDLEEDLEMRGGGVKCAKEKNRQAQRRFRERQKCLIQTLKDREEALRKQVLSCG